MQIGSIQKLTISLVIWAGLTSLPSHAANVRHPDLIRSMPVEGVTLGTTPQAAFDHLVRLGYTPEVPTYNDWWKATTTFTKGDRANPEGEMVVDLARKGSRLLIVSKGTWRPNGPPFEFAGEIEPVRSHFTITEENNDCGTGKHGGACGAEDSDGTMAYVLTVRRTMRTELVSIINELPEALKPPR